MNIDRETEHEIMLRHGLKDIEPGPSAPIQNWYGAPQLLRCTAKTGEEVWVLFVRGMGGGSSAVVSIAFAEAWLRAFTEHVPPLTPEEKPRFLAWLGRKTP